ncbi:hypothetical protein BDV36DRAFT_307579 [Aspergillus pseudocaelatus]|uniref:Uncharacterized protein n=1 Tax=Aspergillus pseudocaelatus TaxID=1825620 RepID=A0ABQ6WR79_9EURO|nr:hypothetical protein BDV36DRAFT_307579 [Aspergillus pseudocaelatus]
MATISDHFVEKTDPAPYGQAIFLSQKSINNGFSALWEAAQDIPDDQDNPDPNQNPLKYFSVPSRTQEYFKFNTGKPEVRLQVTKNGDPMLYFRLRTDKGGLWVFTTDDPNDDTHIDWDIAGFVFAFSVRIGRKEITKDSQEYKDFKDRAGLPNSNFTLAMLFIDASTTTTWNDELSDFRDKADEWRNLTPEARGTIKTWVTKWLNITNEKGQSILGYSAERQEDDELNEYAPTFPPTSIDYYCYPWKGLDGSEAPKDDLDTNALSYLMMSNFEEPPAGGSIEYTGPWVDDGDRQGTFVMNRTLFWPWMNRLLRQMVIAMTPYPDTPFVEWSGANPDLPWSSGIRFHAGDDDAQDSEYQFTKSWNPFYPGFRWFLTGPKRHSEASATNPHDSKNKMILKEDTSDTNARIKFIPGGEQVDLQGSSSFKFRADHQRKHPTYTEMRFGISWSISLVMSSVEDGGLQFQVVKDSDVVEVTHVKEGGMRWGQPPEEIAEEWKNDIKGGLRRSLDRVADKLLNGLADQHRLFLPGKGSYLMNNPIWGKEGDLLVNLNWNGADPPKKKKRHLFYS